LRAAIAVCADVGRHHRKKYPFHHVVACCIAAGLETGGLGRGSSCWVSLTGFGVRFALLCGCSLDDMGSRIDELEKSIADLMEQVVAGVVRSVRRLQGALTRLCFALVTDERRRQRQEPGAGGRRIYCQGQERERLSARLARRVPALASTTLTRDAIEFAVLTSRCKQKITCRHLPTGVHLIEKSKTTAAKY
jgi:hypothetical protein